MTQKFSCAALLLFSCLLAVATRAHASDAADDSGRLSVIEENDKFAGLGDDRHYTQGLELTWLTGSITASDTMNAPFVWLSDDVPLFESGAGKRKVEWKPVGQSIFTPTNLNRTAPTVKDRPYGAWLFTGASFLQETPHETHTTLENAEILGGVVGPLALGALTQNTFHQFIGVNTALGWQNQIHTEPGFVLTYERKWRFEQPLSGNFGVDAIPEAGATLGNVFTYGEVGGTVRMGQNLTADYGANHIRPSPSGTGWFDPTKITTPLGWYVYAGGQGRVVGHNIFLDGNMIGATESVERKPLVADMVVGAAMFWKDSVRLDFSLIQRTKEFTTQQSQDRFGSIGLTVGF